MRFVSIVNCQNIIFVVLIKIKGAYLSQRKHFQTFYILTTNNIEYFHLQSSCQLSVQFSGPLSQKFPAKRMIPLSPSTANISLKKPIKAHQSAFGNFRALDFLNFFLRIFQKMQLFELHSFSGCSW